MACATFADLAAGRDDGWFVPETLSLVRAEKTHEIGSHGFTHLPFPASPREAIQLEVDGIRAWKDRQRIDLKTFIFPRNLIGHEWAMIELGILGYRDRPIGAKVTGFKGRSMNILREYNPIPRSQPFPASRIAPIVIPGDFFLNWRSGPRKFVPASLTLRRFRHAVRHGAKSSGVVHLWLHPHNVITGDHQLELFAGCMDILAEEVKANRIKVATQSEFVTTVLGS